MIVFNCLIVLVQINLHAADAISPKDVARLKELRSQLFEKSHPAATVSELLPRLRDAKKRKNAVRSIIEVGRQHQTLICKFADENPNIEVQEACAEIVRALDDDWRKTASGREYESLARANISTLLPQAWKNFERDPTNLAAIATILSAPPEVVWKWLGPPAEPAKNRGAAKDPHAIYLLLRMRDLSPDEFVAKHLPDIKVGTGSKLAVFPTGSCFRSVGHVRLKQMEYAHDQGVRPSPNGGPPASYTSQLFSLVPVSLHLFRYASVPDSSHRALQQIRFREVQYVLSIRRNFFPSQKPSGPNPTTPSVEQRKPLVRVGFTKKTGGSDQRTRPDTWLAPDLDLSVSQRSGRHDSTVVPWWWRRYVSEANAKRMKFSIRKPGEKAPAEISNKEIFAIGPTGDAAIPPEPPANAASLVVLPPRLTGRQSPEHRLAAELVCDRLVEEIAATGNARIVDRRQLQKILDERTLQTAAGEPLLSFDAFVRLEVDKQQLDATAKISVIDLSTGSELDTRTFAWPFGESKIQSIRTLLNSSIAKVGSTRKTAKAKPVTIRFLGTREPERIRMRKYARRLNQVFSELLKRNPRLLVVEHFAAGSAAEESLLLLMGLSRSPSGRDFTPQADVTLELTLEERETSGVAFEQTPIEGRLLVHTAKGLRTEVAVAKIGDLDSKIVNSLWNKLSERLDAVEPGSAARVIDDMTIRRKQAAKELEAINTIDSNLPQLEQAVARRKHAETALKLDPTSLEATYQLIMAYSQYVSADRMAGDVKDVSFAGLRMAAEHAEEFLAYPAAMRDIQGAANRFSFGYGTIRMSPGPDEDQNSKNRQAIDYLLFIDETALSAPPSAMNAGAGYSIRRSLGRLLLLGEPIDKVKSRVELIIADFERLQAEFDATARPYESIDISDWRAQQQIATNLRKSRQQILSACSELGLQEQFDHLYPTIQSDIRNERNRKTLVALLRSDIRRWKDSQRLNEFEKWVKTLDDSQPVTLQYTTWPELDVFAGTKPAVAKSVPIKVPLVNEEEVIPIARNKDRLFVVTGRLQFIGWGRGNTMSPKQRLGYIPIDRNGKPRGPVQFIRLRDESLDLQIQGHLATDSKLVLGIGSSSKRAGGLDILDLKSNRWSHLGPDDGLPIKSIMDIHGLSDNRALCFGFARRGEYAYCTVNLQSQKIRLYGIGQNKQQKRIPYHLLSVFEEDGRVYGLGEYGLWKNMLSPDAVWFQPGVEPKPKWINIYQGCELDSHFYYLNRGFHKIASSGKTVRSWTKPPVKGTGEVARRIRSGRLSRFPSVPQTQLMSCDNMLLFFAKGGNSVVGFIPQTDTWYGPVAIDRTIYALPDRSSVWLGGDTIRRLPLAKIRKAAEQCDRVFAPGDFERRQLKAVAKTAGLKRAKLEFGLQNFDVAGEHLTSFAKENPTHTGGLFFGGILHDEWGLDQPDKAARFYAQVAKDKAKPSMAFTARYRLCVLLNRSGQTKRASEIATQLLADYPTISSPRIQENAQENLKAIARLGTGRKK